MSAEDPKITKACEKVLSLLKRIENEIALGAIDEAVSALKSLHSLSDVTVAVLARTKAGVRVSKLQTHSSDSLSTVAKNCVRDWKNMAANTSSLKQTTKNSSINSSSSSSSSSLSSSSGVVSAQSGSSSGKFDSATADAHALPPSARLSDSRRRVHEMLRKVLLEVMNQHLQTEAGAAEAKKFSYFANDVKGIETSTNSIASDIEQTLFDALGGGNDEKPSNAYGEQFKTLAFNFKRNSALTLNILYGIVAPEKLVKMTSAELLSDTAKQAAEEARKEAVEATQADWDRKNRAAVLAKAGIDPAEGMLTCPKCKKKNTNFYLKQTRSADEPMTTFANCLTDTCLYRWRF
jgi:transcription elongation factor S-II